MEIESLTHDKGYCYASNETLGKTFDKGKG